MTLSLAISLLSVQLNAIFYSPMNQVYCLGHSVVTPLGFDIKSVLTAISTGKSALTEHDGKVFNLRKPFQAGLIDRAAVADALSSAGQDVSDLTGFEQAVLLSAINAIKEADIDMTSPDVAFILSSATGDKDMLGNNPFSLKTFECAGTTKIARTLGLKGSAVTVSNGGASGVNAQIVAMNMIKSGMCKTAIVTGCDLLSRYVLGMNASADDMQAAKLGEASATMIFTADDHASRGWQLKSGVMNIELSMESSNARVGDGAYKVIRELLKDNSDLHPSFINTNSTLSDNVATYALSRAGMTHLPNVKFQESFGHTMGAAGVFESVMALESADAGIIKSLEGMMQESNSFFNLHTGIGGVSAGVCYAHC